MSSRSKGCMEKLITYFWKCYTWSSEGRTHRDVFLHTAVLRGDLSPCLLTPSFNTRCITERKMVPNSFRNESLLMEANYSRILCCKFHDNFRLQLVFFFIANYIELPVVKYDCLSRLFAWFRPLFLLNYLPHCTITDRPTVRHWHWYLYSGFFEGYWLLSLDAIWDVLLKMLKGLLLCIVRVIWFIHYLETCKSEWPFSGR